MEIRELEWIDIKSSANTRSKRRPAGREREQDFTDNFIEDFADDFIDDYADGFMEDSADGSMGDFTEGHTQDYIKEWPNLQRERQYPSKNKQHRQDSARRKQQATAETRRRMSIDNRIEPQEPARRYSPQTEAVTEPSRRKALQEKQVRRLKRHRKIRMFKSLLLGTAFLVIIGVLLGIALTANQVYEKFRTENRAKPAANMMVEEQSAPQDIREWGKFYATELERPELAVDLLTINEYSRPGELLPEVKNIFIHYTANAGTTAEQNKSYFQSLAETHERSASAHFIIGFDGVIVQCIPTAEIAYAVKERNYDSISIECCFVDESGIFTRETYDSLIELTAWLLHKFELEPEDVLRHYDEGGKICPKYYVEHEDAWRQFLADLENYMANVTDS